MVASRTNDVVALVAFDGLATLEFAIPAEIFGLDRPELSAYYSMVVAAGEPTPLRGAFGTTIEPDGGLDLIESAGTVVVPGWRDRFETPPSALVDSLLAAHSNGARLVSICGGAFVLAATGLLDGGRATTHWLYADDLRGLRPAVEVDESVLFVDRGQVITSAGSAAGIDTCLHVVREDWGAEVANSVARRMVVSPQRDGGQAQFIAEPVPDAGNDVGLADLLDRLGNDLASAHSVSSMADDLHLSERTLARRFKAATGTTPANWLATQRLARARVLLETTDLSIDRVAASVGYGSAVSLRHQFRSRLNISPTAYRRRFASVEHA